jgi:transposase
MTTIIHSREELERLLVTMNGEGWGIRKLAHHFCISRNMVRRVLRKHASARNQGHDIVREQIKQATPRHSKLDPFVERIKELFKDFPKITGQRVYEEITAAGYNGGISILQDRLRILRPTPKKTPVIRFETAPGLQGQMDISASNLQNSKKSFEISSRVKHCFEVNKCVFLDLQLHHPDGRFEEGSSYVGGIYKPWNSDFMVLESGAGSVCTQREGSKGLQCSPALKASASSMVDAGWNTKVTGKVGCEGVYCGDFFASIQAAVTPHPRITIIPMNCKISTNRDQTACLAEVKIITDPLPIGAQH